MSLPRRNVPELVEALRSRAVALTGAAWERTATHDIMKEAAQQLEDLAPLLDVAIRIVRNNRRHVEVSPGVGSDAQTYALAVCDDILIDLMQTAARHP